MADYTSISGQGSYSGSFPSSGGGGGMGFDPSGFGSLLSQKWQNTKNLMDMEMQERQWQMQMQAEQLQMQKEAQAQQFALAQEQNNLKRQEIDAPMELYRYQQQLDSQKGQGFAEAMRPMYGLSNAWMGAGGMEKLGGVMGLDKMTSGMQETGKRWAEIGGGASGGGGGGAPEESDFMKLYNMGYSPGAIKNFGGGGVEGAKTGGTIPEDGVYQLHKGEKVIPTPETFKEVLMEVLTSRPVNPDTSGRKPKGSFKMGMPNIKEELKNEFYGGGEFGGKGAGREFDEEEDWWDGLIEWSDVEDEDQGYAAEQAAMGSQQTRPLRMRRAAEMAGKSLEGMPTEEVPLPEDVQEDIPIDFGGEEEPPQAAGAYQGAASERMGMPGYGVEEQPISERKMVGRLGGQDLYNRPETDQKTVRKYTMSGKPMTPDEEFMKDAQAKAADIEAYSGRARGLLQTAANLEMYAMERPNAVSSANLMAMAKEKRQQAKAMLDVAKTKQEALDEWQQKAAETIAAVTAREIEQETERIRTRGRLTEADIQARGGMAEKEIEAKLEGFFKMITSLGELGMEKEAREIISKYLPLFMPQGGGPEQGG